VSAGFLDPITLSGYDQAIVAERGVQYIAWFCMPCAQLLTGLGTFKYSVFVVLFYHFLLKIKSVPNILTIRLKNVKIINMNTFSKRNKFDPQIPQAPVVEDAPKLLRLEYWSRILEPLTYIDKDTRYSKNTGVLGRKKLLEDLCIMLHIEPTDNMSDSWFCTDELKGLIMDTPWYQFYDLVEGVAKELELLGNAHSIDYRNGVNETFENNMVVWRLNDKGILERVVLQDLQEKAMAVENILEQGFPATLQHLRKAKGFVTNLPLDPENAIKEAVSAVESYGRFLYPKSSTFGEVIKELRKTPFPSLILVMMEKFYAFASSEPGVRHGSSISSTIGLADADFCLYVSIAFVDYLHKLHNKNIEGS